MTLISFPRAARPATRKHLPVEPSHDRAGRPINPLVGFIYPSDPPRDALDRLTNISLFLIVSICAVGIAIADAVFR